METKETNTFLKGLIALIIQILLPSLLIIGTAFLVYFISIVGIESNNTILTLLSILTFIIALLLIAFVSIFLTSGALADVFASNNKIEYIITYKGNDTFSIEEKKPDSTGALIMTVIIGILISLIGIPLFIIGFTRLIFSKNYRLLYSERFEDFKDMFIEHKIKFSIGIIVTILYFFPITMYGIEVQKQHNIDIFSQFRKTPEIEIVHIEPTLEVTDMQIYPGGYYINGYIVELTTNIEYIGELDISSIEGEITIYNSANVLLITASCSYSDITDSCTRTLQIVCSNTQYVRELLNYNIEQVSMYFRLNKVYYTDYTSREYSSYYKVN